MTLKERVQERFDAIYAREMAKVEAKEVHVPGNPAAKAARQDLQEMRRMLRAAIRHGL